MIISGLRSPKIGEIKITDTICETCGKQSINNITVLGRYVHVFWIPTFPAGRIVVSECEECQFTSKKKKFSPQLKRRYKQHKRQVKRPIWHWSGSILAVLLITWFSVVISNVKTDSRKELLQADLNLMVSNPTLESDSVSYAIKEMMDSFITEELQPNRFEYYTRVDSNQALVLVKIPRLRKIRKEERLGILEMIEFVIKTTPGLEDKELYIGIEGRISILVLKTPHEQKNGRFIPESPLYEFYGPKEKENELEE